MPPCQREHQCHRTIRPHATGAPLYMRPCSGSTDFTVLNAPVLAGAPISQLSSGAPISPCYMRPRQREHQFHRFTILLGAPFSPCHMRPAGAPQFICASGSTNFTILANAKLYIRKIRKPTQIPTFGHPKTGKPGNPNI